MASPDDVGVDTRPDPSPIQPSVQSGDVVPPAVTVVPPSRPRGAASRPAGAPADAPTFEVDPIPAARADPIPPVRHDSALAEPRTESDGAAPVTGASDDGEAGADGQLRTARRRRGRRGRGRAGGPVGDGGDGADQGDELDRADQADEVDAADSEGALDGSDSAGEGSSAETAATESAGGASSSRTRARRRRRVAARTRERGDATADPSADEELAGTAATTGAGARSAAHAVADGDAASERGEEPAGGAGSTARPAGGRNRRRGRSGTAGSTDQPDVPAAPTLVASGVAAASAGVAEARAGDAMADASGQAPSAPTRVAARSRGTGRGGRRRRQIGLTEEQKRVLREEGPEKRMLVTESADRTQIAVLEGRTLVEHYVTRKSGRSMVGNIYLGRVQNVLPGMEAAFVDIGRGRNGVLYAGEVTYNEEDLEGEPPRIEHALKPGQGVLVQVSKDPIGAKGARLTGQVSLAGRYLVLQPDVDTFGISRRLPEEERSRLREILKAVRPSGTGVIVRTAAEGASADDLRTDLARLQARWDQVVRKSKSASAPAPIYEEPDLVVRVIRDIFSPDFVELVVGSDGLYETVHDYLDEVAPDLLPRLRRHSGSLPLFEHYMVVEQIHKALDRKVWLPSGGSIVIDRTEAMTVVDVNTGRFVGKSNLEETVVENNLEAAEEIVRQLRLRDIGGIIIIDFIDMLFERNQQAVIDRLKMALARDKTKSQVMAISPLGLVQMTRKRVSSGLLDSFSEPCPHCEGRGVVITHDV